MGEALRRNPEINAARHRIGIADGRASQAGSLSPPTLTYMRDQMTGFNWSEAMWDQWDLMQMVMFPTKLSTQSAIGSLQRSQSVQEFDEKGAEICSRVRSVYAEFWSLQQSAALMRENVALMKQFAELARNRISVGTASLQDALKAEVEAAKMENQLTGIEQKEMGMAAMLSALTGRPAGDRIGKAVLPALAGRPVLLDTLQALAVAQRPMLRRDSLMVEEGNLMVSMAKKEYLPDLTLGLRYYRYVNVDQRAWSVMAGISIPFAPWALGRASGRVEEAEAGLLTSRASYDASRAMVLASVTDLYHRAESAWQQLKTYNDRIIPQAHDALISGVTAYQTGKTDFLMLIDSFRMNLELSMEAIMTRMQFEQSSAELGRAIGLQPDQMEKEFR